MKKIPTLFVRRFENRRIVGITPEITPGCEDAFRFGVPTVKVDGSCCAIIDGKFYKRYDAKKGKKPPEEAIPCCDPDPVTGHWPHWVPVNKDNPGDKWFIKAYENSTNEFINNGVTSIEHPCDGTYEAVGLHFNGNPYGMDYEFLYSHGCEEVLSLDRTFEGVRDWLTNSRDEGIVFWLNGEPVCKIKRTDFGLDWPIKEKK